MFISLLHDFSVCKGFLEQVVRHITDADYSRPSLDDHKIFLRQDKMATVVRRLEDMDVRAVFECLHEGKPPPRNLPFRIVPVSHHGLKLSPPSHEFEDGLYVLLRPRSKSKEPQNQPQVPSHLTKLLMKELPPETCPWSLSGPQFPQPTAIQQRYCYPKGRPEYSSQKGGALWTMYRKDGKEDLTFRLLHVYYSAKRAVNKGVASSPMSPGVSTSPTKRFKTKTDKQWSQAHSTSAHHRAHTHLSPGGSYPLKSPAMTATTVNSPSTCHSPLSFCGFPPLSPARPFQKLPLMETSNFIYPPDDHFFQAFESPFRSRGTPCSDSLLSPHSPPNHEFCDFEDEDSQDCNVEPFPYDGVAPEIDLKWSDPLLNIILKPSIDDSAGVSSNFSYQAVEADPGTNLALQLDSIHQSLCESILVNTGSIEQQMDMLSVVVHWARHVASDPLACGSAPRSGPLGVAGMDDENDSIEDREVISFAEV